MKKALLRVMALCGLLASPAVAADEVAVVFNRSDPEVVELLEPLRLSCLRTLVADGKTQDEAFSALPTCLSKRFLSAIELERSIRTYFPSKRSPIALDRCINETEEDTPLLPCVQGAEK